MQELTSEFTINRTIVFRADGNAKIGFGHVYRMLALIEMVKANSPKIIFVTEPLPESIIQHISKLPIDHRIIPALNMEIPDKQDNQGISLDMDLLGDELVVLDGYHFGKEYQTSIVERGNKLLVIDDFGVGKFVANAVINHAPGAKYSNNSLTKFYTGLNYAVLRMPFFNPLKKRIKDKKVAYVCLGGSDYMGYSLRILDLINEFGGFDSINLVFTSQYPKQLINKFKSYQSKISLNLHTDLSAMEIVSLLDKSTHAFVSASTVLLECYARGLYCFTGYYTKNQQMIYEGFINNNLACSLGDFSTLDLKAFKRALSKIPKNLSQPLNSANHIIRIFSQL